MKYLLFVFSSILFFLLSCSHPRYVASENANPDSSMPYDARRGSPAEYDAGAPLDSKWIELYGSTPNYRGIGIETLNGKPLKDEKFRWVFGPMWYRGRLTPESVKVFVVGQEGAQDENISNRAFTGSTGTRVQKFLNHMGIYESYLFMNTFVYTINGQLTEEVNGKPVKIPEFAWLEQGEGSPIVEYRHSLFDYMLETNSNSVALFMGVGAGGKASLATWINARGGNCKPFGDLKGCDTTGMASWFKKNKNILIQNKILAIGVPHPGGANPNLGGDAQMKNIIRGFTDAATRVAEFKESNPNWLKPDSAENLSGQALIQRMKSPFKYGHAPIPFRDFAFNTNWRMGAKGTTSNRWGSDSIQVFSDEGIYNDKSSKFTSPKDHDSGLSSDKTRLNVMPADDLPYESPRFHTKLKNQKTFDSGPCVSTKSETSCELSKLLTNWPDFKNLGLQQVSHPSLGFNGSYRGRAHGAEVFVLADQESHDDLFSARALTGKNGQLFQTFLETINPEKKYFILRTLPVDTLGSDLENLTSVATQTKMISQYQKIFNEIQKNSKIKIFIALGPVAQKITQSLEIDKMIQVVLMDYPEKNMQEWSKHANSILNTLGHKKQVELKNQLTTIPREDLPYHTRWWMGSSGDRAARGEGKSLGDYYRVWAPNWVKRLYPKPLSTTEKNNLKKTMNTHLKKIIATEEDVFEVQDSEKETESE